jgi:hypothetical protein
MEGNKLYKSRTRAKALKPEKSIDQFIFQSSHRVVYTWFVQKVSGLEL